MGARGPKPWEPTPDERRLVEHYASIGYTQEQIGALMGKSVDSLDRYCRQELDTGAMSVNAKVAGKLFQKAMGGDTTAMIFWLKTRARWKETSNVEVNAKVASSLDLSGLTPDQVAALAAIRIPGD